MNIIFGVGRQEKFLLATPCFDPVPCLAQREKKNKPYTLHIAKLPQLHFEQDLPTKILRQPCEIFVQLRVVLAFCCCADDGCC